MSGFQITAVREGDHLVPTCEMFREDLQRVPERTEVVVTIRRSRSSKHLRFYFAKLKEVIRAGFWDGDTDSLLSYIKIGVGHCVTVIDNTSSMVSGSILALAESFVKRFAPASDEARLARALIALAGPKTFLVPKSISFEAIGQDEFSDFDKRTDKFLAERLGVDVDELMKIAGPAAASPVDATEAVPAVEPTDPPVAEPAPRPAPAQAVEDELSKRFFSIAWKLGEGRTVAKVQGIREMHAAEFNDLTRINKGLVAAIYELAKQQAGEKISAEAYGEKVGMLVDAAAGRAGENSEKAA